MQRKKEGEKEKRSAKLLGPGFLPLPSAAQSLLSPGSGKRLTQAIFPIFSSYAAIIARKHSDLRF